MIKAIERTKGGLDVMIDRAHDAVIGGTEPAERGVESAAGHVIEQARATEAQVRDGADAASRTAHRRLDAAAKAVESGYVRARSDLSRLAGAATDCVTENPGRTALSAVAGGFLIGLLLGRFKLSHLASRRSTPSSRRARA